MEMTDRPHHHHYGSEQITKYLQANANHAPNDNTFEAKTITTIHYDCLERIFDFLDLESLLNVAGTCKHLQNAAATKFGYDFGSKEFFLYRSTHHNDKRPSTSGIYTLRGPIRIDGLKFCFPFLRCFGGKISHLEVNYNHMSDSQKDHLDWYINQYCAETLISFSFRHGNIFSMENFTKPFKCVEKIEFSYFSVGKSLKNFSNWFPNLRHMQMIRINFDETAIAVSFPHLEHLKIFIQNYFTNDFTLQNALNFLHANPQLKSLEMSFFEFKLNELLNIFRGNTSISKVVLDGGITDMNVTELNRFRSEQPSIENLVIQNSIFELD